MLRSAAAARLPGPVRRWADSPAGRRLIRFGPAAGLALAATQLTYFICASGLHTTGRVTGAAGWLAGAVVSYAASRWAWERRGRPRLLQETLPFVAISLVAGLVLVEASHLGYVEATRLGLHGIAFVGCAQGIYLAANAGTFIARFLLFNLVVFADRRISPAALYTRSRQLIHEVGRFGVVGLAGLAVADGGANLLQYQAGLGPFGAAALATVAATAVTLLGSRYWTFRHRERTGMGRETAAFFILNGIGIGIYESCIGLADLVGQRSGLAYSIALNAGIVLGTIFRYWSYKKWVWPAAATGTVTPAHRLARLARLAREVVPELARFAAVAAVAVLVSGAVTGLLLGPAGAGPVTAALTGAAAAVLLSYPGNRYWTFRHRQRSTVLREGTRYLLLSAATLAIQVGGVWVTADLLGPHGRLPESRAAVAGIALVLLLRYWFCRTWVWQAPRSVPAAGA
jgi:putative flippase GtrA